MLCSVCLHVLDACSSFRIDNLYFMSKFVFGKRFTHSVTNSDMGFFTNWMSKWFLFHQKRNGKCVVFRSGGRFPWGSQKRQSRNDEEHDPRQERKKPSTFDEAKITKSRFGCKTMI